MRKDPIQKIVRYLMVFPLLFLTSCSKYTGLRTPLYDGQPIKPDEEAIEVYQASAEVIGAEKDFYIRYVFSEDILQESLDYPEAEPVLLEEGRYLIGTDLPAGRASLLGNESSFSIEHYDVHVGNLIIRDEAGDVYFENLFHSEYGQLTAQLDLIQGHEITIIGKDPEITVFYEENLPKNPYVLMDVPDLIKNTGRINIQQPVNSIDGGKIVRLTAGIYEVGLHIPAGEYILSDLIAPHNTEMYLFQESLSPRVIELLMEPPTYLEVLEDSAEEIQTRKDKTATVQLLVGDKIYLNLVEQLELIQITAE